MGMAKKKERLKKKKRKKENKKKKNIKKIIKAEEKTKESGFDMAKVKAAIQAKLQDGKIKEEHSQILEQRAPVEHAIGKTEFLSHKKNKAHKGKWVNVGIPGFDDLLDKGIPKGTTTLICGGPGSGKTIFALQTLSFGATNGEKCVYMTFEESEGRLRNHMRDFGWDAEKLEKKGNLLIKRYDPFAITRQVEALLEKSKGELLIDVSPILFPKDFKPDRVVIDSLSAIAAAFVGKEDTYRIYIEQLFRLLEQIGATSFLITESTQIPIKLTSSGVEEFLADGVVVLYNIQRENIRESAIEILKLRGAGFQKKMVAMEIKGGVGIIVYPKQEVFGSTE